MGRRGTEGKTEPGGIEAAIRTLTPMEFGAYGEHLRRLSPEDRGLRFGRFVDDGWIDAYVAALDPLTTSILVHQGADLAVRGAVQISRHSAGEAELAFTVDSALRGSGLGRRLMARALLFLRNRGIRRACLHTTFANKAMRRVAVAVGMALDFTDGDVVASMTLPAATPLSVAEEWMAEAVGLFRFSRLLWLRLPWATSWPLASQRPAIL